MAKDVHTTQRAARRRKAEFGLYAIAITAVVVFSGALLLSVNRISDSRAAIYASRTTGSWVAFSIELEYRRFMEALTRYGLGDGGVSHDTLMRRFDIFWSRVPLLVTGPDAERLKLAPQTDGLESDLMAALRRVEPGVTSLEAGDRAAYRQIRAELEPFGQRLRDLLITVEIDLKQNFLQEVVDSSYRRVFISFTGVLVGGAVLVLLLFVQLRRVARLSRAHSRASAEARAANQAKSEFLARMTHELRTPLNAVIGYSELMQEEAAEKGYREMLGDLERIHIAGNHLLSMINDTLDLAKIETGRLELSLERTDVQRLTRDVAEAIQPLARRNGNRLEVDVAEVGPVKTDPTKLRQILFNLLSNASKFTENGVISLQVRGETEGGVRLLSFRVRDSGPGIPESERKKIFQPFVQANGTANRSVGGTGLGLSVAHSLCALMGGSIALECDPNGGTTFIVRLPTNITVAEEEHGDVQTARRTA